MDTEERTSLRNVRASAVHSFVALVLFESVLESFRVPMRIVAQHSMSVLVFSAFHAFGIDDSIVFSTLLRNNQMFSDFLESL
jgi:hypothetical protein